MARYTLLQIVQRILNDMDSEEVNSLEDTSEALQVASVVEDTFYAIISNRLIPEHKEMTKLTAASDSDTPTHFTYPTNASHITKVWYDTSDDGSFDYTEVQYVTPEAFLEMTDKRTDDYTSVEDPVSGVKLRIQNNKMPEFYTSFDDNYVVMDSHDATVDSTLTTAKSRALCQKVPTFTIDDSFVPDIDENYFPLLIAESKAVCMSLFKGAVDPKIEQQARRQRVRIQNDLYKTTYTKGISKYGR